MIHSLSVEAFRQKMQEERGFVDEMEVAEYALKRQAEKSLSQDKTLSLENIEYQKEVLERMAQSGCKDCEKRQQEKYIKQLEEALSLKDTKFDGKVNP